MSVLDMLEEAGAVYTGRHFVYKSGRHGPAYVDMDRVYPHLPTMWKLATLMVECIPEPRRIEVVVGPAVGGVALASDVAHRLLQLGIVVDRLWVDKNGDDFAFERAGFAERVKGKRVLVVEDLLTTGGSVKKACAQVEAAGGEVVAVVAICNRGGLTTKSLGWPLYALCEVSFEAVLAEQCQLCADNVPIVSNIGHGSGFQTANSTYEGGYTEL